jgi:hypothetical protein
MKKQYLIASIVLVAMIAVPFLASADAVTETITNITEWIITVSLSLAALMYIVGGFLWMSDAGNIERVKIAKNIIMSTTIGLIVILMAGGIKSIVETLVSK